MAIYTSQIPGAFPVYYVYLGGSKRKTYLTYTEVMTYINRGKAHWAV